MIQHSNPPLFGSADFTWKSKIHPRRTVPHISLNCENTFVLTIRRESNSKIWSSILWHSTFSSFALPKLHFVDKRRANAHLKPLIVILLAVEMVITALKDTLRNTVVSSIWANKITWLCHSTYILIHIYFQMNTSPSSECDHFTKNSTTTRRSSSSW